MTASSSILTSATRLPTPRTTLIGRGEDVTAVSAMLLDPDIRLVSITGPGGAGKTRLGLEVAHLLADRFREGAWFIPLAAIREPSMVIPTIGQFLGLRDTGELSMSARLSQRLRSDDILLMLDNLEQVREVGPTIGHLLQTCPGVTVLVTSRTVLHLTFEHVYALAGLPLPEASARSEPSDLMRNDAVRLFVSRVQRHDATFQLNRANGRPIADICRRLDGLPLALELAAVRAPAMSLTTLRDQLASRLTTLAGQEQELPPRHQALADTVDWSIQLMDPDERAAFLRLAVLAGPFTAAMAAAVIHEPADPVSVVDPVNPADALLDATYDLLGSLVDQSLVRPMPDGGDEPRFRMLQTIREVALDVLTADGEEPAARRRHALACLALAEAAAPQLTGPTQARWLETLQRSLDDLRAAMAWLDEAGDHERQLRLATALWRFGYTRGHFSETRTWLQEALAASGEPSPTRVAALNALGLLASTQGEAAIATECHDAALAMAREIGDQRGTAAALNGLGDAAAVTGDRASARDSYDRALALYRALGDRRGIAGALTNLGNLAWDGRDLDRAITLHGEALAAFRAIDERRGIAWELNNLGTLAAEQGNLDRARDYLREAHGLYQELGDPTGVILTLEGFAEIAHTEGQPPLEATLRAAASALRDAVGAPIAPGIRDWYEQTLDRVRAELGSEFDRIWRAGRAMSVEAAIDMALDPAWSTGDGGASLPGPDPAVTFGLSPREAEIVRLVTAGRTSQQIADELAIGVRTVDTHITNALRKMEVPTRSALAAVARREGLA